MSKKDLLYRIESNSFYPNLHDGMAQLTQNVSGILLAAGNSSRLGQPKQLLSYRGATLLEHTLLQSVQVPLKSIVVVVGAYAEEVASLCASYPVAIRFNPAWQTGMGSSLKKGLETLQAEAPCAALVMVCDQPYLQAEHLRKLVNTWQDKQPLIVASSYGGALGVPAIFSAKLFEEMQELPDGIGARKLIQRHAHQVLSIPFEKGIIDIDTPADYHQLRKSEGTTY